MRKVQMSDLLETLAKKNITFDASNIQYNGTSLEEYLDNQRNEMISLSSAEPEEVSEIKDNTTAFSYTWSSEKISEEIAKQRRRLDNIVAVDKETISDTEMIDMRTDIDGNYHDTAGNATRYQIENLRNELEKKASKADLRGMNQFDATSFRVANDAFIGKKYSVNGNDTNIITVPNIENYMVSGAINTNYEANNFFIMGTAQGKDTSYIFVNRVIPEVEVCDIYVTYTKVMN